MGQYTRSRLPLHQGPMMVEQATLHVLSPDTQAILLLCGRFGQAQTSGIEPLKLQEYDGLARWLHNYELWPHHLLEGSGQAALQKDDLPVDAQRIQGLLQRGAALGLAIESWTNKGLWVVGRSDPEYPRRLKDRLKGLAPAPPVLYGAGARELLNCGGLAIVGSRDADDGALDFTRRVAQTAASQEIPIISGGARGVDSEAMSAAIQEGGTAIGVLADSLLKTAISGKYRNGIMNDKIVLVSPYDPTSGFNVGNAMGRNKYVYALADWGLVVTTATGKGGTWAGATEALQKHGRSVYVRVEEMVPDGNHKLVELGAKSFPNEPWTDLRTQLANDKTDIYDMQAEPPSQQELASNISTIDKPHVLEVGLTDRPEISTNGSSQSMPAYEIILPHLLNHLQKPLDKKDLANILEIVPSQAEAWLKKACQEYKVRKVKGSKPIQYVVSQQRPLPNVRERPADYPSEQLAGESSNVQT